MKKRAKLQNQRRKASDYMTVIKVFEKPKLENPILIEGLPGVGNIGRVAAGYLVEELGAKKFAELYSKWFFPFVILHDEYKIHLLKNEFYYVKANKNCSHDIIILTGDCQSLSPQGHYEVSTKILEFVKEYGDKEIITIGGLATGELEEKEQKIIGAVTHDELLEKYKNKNLEFYAGKKVGYIVGATGLLLGIGAEMGMKGVCLLGQTAGYPIITDPKAAEEVLMVLTDILKMKVDMSKIGKRVAEMEEFIKKVEILQKKALAEMTKESKPREDETRYIG